MNAASCTHRASSSNRGLRESTEREPRPSARRLDTSREIGRGNSMIEIKIDGIQAEGRFDCADGEILSDDIRRVLIALYRVVCEAANDETADKAMQYIMALIGSGVIKKDYEQMMQIAGAENGN